MVEEILCSVLTVPSAFRNSTYAAPRSVTAVVIAPRPHHDVAGAVAVEIPDAGDRRAEAVVVGERTDQSSLGGGDLLFRS